MNFKTAKETITITGIDVLICQVGRPDVVAWVCCNPETERIMFDGPDRINTGNHIRTAFGLTLYSHNAQEFNEIERVIKKHDLSVSYAYL